MGRGTYSIDLKAAATLLDPEDWENLIHDKEGKLSLIAAKANSAATSTAAYAAAFDFLSSTTVARSLGGIFKAASDTCLAIGSYASRKRADLQLKSTLSRLANGDGCGGRYAGDARLELLALHSAALKGKHSAAIQLRIFETRLHCLSSYLETRPYPAESMVYKDLVELLSIACVDEYPKSLLHRVWDIFLRELRVDGGVRLIVNALTKCDEGDVHLVLRHLAVSHILAWSSVVLVQSTIQSEEIVRRAARKVSFAWDTYDGYLRATEGFYGLIHGVLVHSPSLAHASFDNRLHFLWLKYLQNSAGEMNTLNFAWVVDSLVQSLATYPTRPHLDLTLELQCLVLFVATAPDGNSLAVSAAKHAVSAIITLAAASPLPTAISALYRDHPSLSAGHLAHPAQPFILFAAKLVQENRIAAEQTISSGIVEALSQLWRADFALNKERGTGRWVMPVKGGRAMKLATVLLMSALAAHGDLHEQIGDRILATKEVQAWFWNATSFALASRYDDDSGSMNICETLKQLAFFVMKNYNLLPGDINREAALENDHSMVWILQTTGDPSTDLRLRIFSLDVLISRVMGLTTSWNPALAILVNCQKEEKEPLRVALSDFISHFVRSNEFQLDLKHDNTSSPMHLGSLYILNYTKFGACDDPSGGQRKFMSNPLDRFVMFISNASRRNRHVASALHQSNVLQLVKLLLAGRFDSVGLDPSSRGWRERICSEIMGQRRIQAAARDSHDAPRLPLDLGMFNFHEWDDI